MVVQLEIVSRLKIEFVHSTIYLKCCWNWHYTPIKSINHILYKYTGFWLADIYSWCIFNVFFIFRTNFVFIPFSPSPGYLHENINIFAKMYLSSLLSRASRTPLPETPPPKHSDSLFFFYMWKVTWIILRPLSALSLDEGLNALSDKNPSGCWLGQPTNQMSDISAYAH